MPTTQTTSVNVLLIARQGKQKEFITQLTQNGKNNVINTATGLPGIRYANVNLTGKNGNTSLILIMLSPISPYFEENLARVRQQANQAVILGNDNKEQIQNNLTTFKINIAGDLESAIQASIQQQENEQARLASSRVEQMAIDTTNEITNMLTTAQPQQPPKSPATSHANLSSTMGGKWFGFWHKISNLVSNGSDKGILPLNKYSMN